MAPFVRQRAGDKHRPSRKPFDPTGIYSETHDKSITAVACEAGNTYECSEAKEVYSGSDVIGVIEVEIEDRSLTRRQLLRIGSRQIEVEPVVTRQLDKVHFKKTGEVKLIQVNNNRVTWKSDRTLLNRSKPFAKLAELKRQTSKTKQIRFDPDTEFRQPKEHSSEVDPDFK